MAKPAQKNCKLKKTEEKKIWFFCDPPERVYWGVEKA
jgi:hypothetical protein